MDSISWKCVMCAVLAALAGCEGAAPTGDGGWSCGDGVVQAPEACDDGNAITGDGCSASCMREVPGELASEVVDAPGASGSGYGDPSRATNGVRGGGDRMQSVDVYSIGIGEGAWLVLGFGGLRVADGPGDDLVIFENAFGYGDGLTFMDPAVVEVSADGETWVAFPHDYVAEDERAYSPRAEDWIGFAGLTPVALHAEDNAVDPFGDEAGGDRFDLAALDGPEGERIRLEGARFVRISSAASHVNPDTGEPFVKDLVGDGPDIDGVAARILLEAQ